MLFSVILTLAICFQTVHASPAQARSGEPQSWDLHANEMWKELSSVQSSSKPAASGVASWHHRHRPHKHKTCSASPVHSSKPTSSLAHSAKPTPSKASPTPSSSSHPSPASSQAPSASVASTPPAIGLSPTTFEASYLGPHNKIRQTKGAVALVWNNTLATYAHNWASKCDWNHSGGPNGENLAAGNGTFTAGDGVNMWIGEESSYSSSNPQPSHYTQVVWKGSKQLGCAEVTCENLLGQGSGAVQYHVCEYFPPGNVIGEFAANVEA